MVVSFSASSYTSVTPFGQAFSYFEKILKEQSNKTFEFRPAVFHHSNLHWPLTSGLKHLRFRQSFCQVIQTLSSKKTGPQTLERLARWDWLAGVSDTGCRFGLVDIVYSARGVWYHLESDFRIKLENPLENSQGGFDLWKNWRSTISLDCSFKCLKCLLIWHILLPHLNLWTGPWYILTAGTTRSPNISTSSTLQ